MLETCGPAIYNPWALPLSFWNVVVPKQKRIVIMFSILSEKLKEMIRWPVIKSYTAKGKPTLPFSLLLLKLYHATPNACFCKKGRLLLVCVLSRKGAKAITVSCCFCSKQESSPTAALLPGEITEREMLEGQGESQGAPRKLPQGDQAAYQSRGVDSVFLSIAQDLNLHLRLSAGIETGETTHSVNSLLGSVVTNSTSSCKPARDSILACKLLCLWVVQLLMKKENPENLQGKHRKRPSPSWTEKNHNLPFAGSSHSECYHTPFTTCLSQFYFDYFFIPYCVISHMSLKLNVILN